MEDYTEIVSILGESPTQARNFVVVKHEFSSACHNERGRCRVEGARNRIRQVVHARWRGRLEALGSRIEVEVEALDGQELYHTQDSQTGGTVDDHMEGNVIMNTLQIFLCIPSLENGLEYPH